jgi:hypothetical protein
MSDALVELIDRDHATDVPNGFPMACGYMGIKKYIKIDEM